jgi:hypothetical protein
LRKPACLKEGRKEGRNEGNKTVRIKEEGMKARKKEERK